MDKVRLGQLIDQLELELSSAGELDDMTAARLREAMQEMENALDRDQRIESQPLVQRMREALYHLPENHPAIKNTIGRIADALAGIGI